MPATCTATQNVLFVSGGGDCSSHRGTPLLAWVYGIELTTAWIDREKTNELPDNIITVGVERFGCAEVLFLPKTELPDGELVTVDAKRRKC